MADFSNISRLINRVRTAAQKGAVTGGLDLVDETLVRVHARGEATDGSKLSSYSEKPYFTSLSSFTNRGGIPSNLISNNNRWVQLPEGYKSFRAFSGRQTRQKDLRYTGLLEKAYKLIPKPDGNGFQTGYIGAGQDPDPSTGVTPAEKMAFAEKREGKDIIKPNREELQLVRQGVEFEINRVL